MLRAVLTFCFSEENRINNFFSLYKIIAFYLHSQNLKIISCFITEWKKWFSQTPFFNSNSNRIEVQNIYIYFVKSV